MADAAALIKALDLLPHPEGGHFRETWRAATAPGTRAAGTAIYYLLQKGEVSAWHRIDAAEIWHFYAGAPLRLTVRADGRDVALTLGPEVADGQVPQGIVPPDAWQTAESLGEYSLVGCTVSPGFEFEHFELAPPGGPIKD